jgi:hypothetical protein
MTEKQAEQLHSRIAAGSNNGGFDAIHAAQGIS